MIKDTSPSPFPFRAIAGKAEELAQQEKAAEEQRTELNKRMLEMQLSQSESGKAGNDSTNLYNQKESLPGNIGVWHQLEEISKEWNQPEEIEKVASWLADCETIEMLRELRDDTPPPEGLEKYVIPPMVFKLAARSLEAGKRRQIKEWVLALNAEKEGAASAG